MLAFDYVDRFLDEEDLDWNVPGSGNSTTSADVFDAAALKSVVIPLFELGVASVKCTTSEGQNLEVSSIENRK